ncbi:hypothetical protein ACFQ6S_23990 [Streptomyces sp. NPDC056479]|uniref:hypothetical protein n=1 Tax=Streptomyces sp. NPDC056479 TaxID=3345832 RepID=UPI0036A8E184
MADSRTVPRTRGPVARVFLWLGGGVIAFAATFWVVTATTDLALSVGVYGTPGTYKVASCHDTDASRKNSDISCYGDFTPDGGGADGAVYVRLEDTGHDYPDGTEFAARQGLEPETIQRAGIRGVTDELWQIGFAAAILCWLAYMAVRPPQSGRPNPGRVLSRREKVAERLMGGVVVCVGVGVLGFLAGLVEEIAF